MFDALKKGINDITTQAQDRMNVAKDAKGLLDNADTSAVVQVKKAAEDAVDADTKALAAVAKLVALYETAEAKMGESVEEQQFGPLKPSYKERGEKIKEALKILQSSEAPPLPAISKAEKDAINVIRAKEALGVKHQPGASASEPIVVQGEVVTTETSQNI
mmetsp:Transcript_55861/g.103406  ORF Transcript_55861/g.103406 Transcript_55861/m.103406 type:complete len:161 (+) Transcript_55861:87-569(+)